jgi:hypothetical protein
MKNRIDARKVWFVKFPLFKYKEDVKDLARRNNLKIVDFRYKSDAKQVANAPELTLIGKDK